MLMNVISTMRSEILSLPMVDRMTLNTIAIFLLYLSIKGLVYLFKNKMQRRHSLRISFSANSTLIDIITEMLRLYTSDILIKRIDGDIEWSFRCSNTTFEKLKTMSKALYYTFLKEE